MAGICTNSVRKSHATDVHRVVTVALDGESLATELDAEWFDALDWNAQLPLEWRHITLKELYVLLGIKKLQVGGVLIENLKDRVTNGEEATNVKQYPLLMKDVIKSNIGTSYVNVPIGANGERTLIDFTGCTQFRVVLTANLPGTGPFSARVVRDSDSAVLFEQTGITSSSGTGAGTERELDTDWRTLPSQASGLIYVRLQARSAAAADDPVFRKCVLGVQ